MTNEAQPQKAGLGLWLSTIALAAAMTVRFLPESLGIPELARKLCEEAASPMALGLVSILNSKYFRASAAAAKESSLRTLSGLMGIIGWILILLGITSAARIVLG